MKRLAIAGIFGIAALTASAVSYRGFFDIMGGVGTGGKTNVYAGSLKVTDIKAEYAFGLNTTHGCQIFPYLYAGVGVGAYSVLTGGKSYDSSYYYNPSDSYVDHTIAFYSINIPMYVDIRWDLDIRKKITPFVDLKIGYQIGVNIDESGGTGYSYNEGGYLDTYAKPENGVYFMPTIGARFRMGRKSGFNLGICYNPFVRKKIEAQYSYNTVGGGYDDMTVQEYDVRKVTDGAFMLSLSFDF